MAARLPRSVRREAASQGSRRAADAIALLRADHKLVQDLFDQFDNARSEDKKASLVESICEELTVHAQIEEEIFYPAAREALGDEDLQARRRSVRCKSYRAR